MEIVIDFNDGLSLIFPTSCFVKFKESGFQIDGAYNNIIEKDITDIIFYGKLVENIEDYIPVDCFIDYRQFETNQELYDFITFLVITQIT